MEEPQEVEQALAKERYTPPLLWLRTPACRAASLAPFWFEATRTCREVARARAALDVFYANAANTRQVKMRSVFAGTLASKARKKKGKQKKRKERERERRPQAQAFSQVTSPLPPLPQAEERTERRVDSEEARKLRLPSRSDYI